MFADTIFGFFALFILTKVLGKTQISQLTAFDFISAVLLGELVGNALFEKENGIPEIAFVVVLWGILLYSIEKITQKFKRTRHFLEGKPSLIIHKGELIRDVMTKNKIDMDGLQQLLREKDVFALKEVEYAVLETDGTISVLKKDAYQTPTKKDLNVAPTQPKLARTLISDGEIIWDNLREANLTEEWLRNEIERQNYSTVEDVFYAEYIEGERLYIYPFKNKTKRNTD